MMVDGSNEGEGSNEKTEEVMSDDELYPEEDEDDVIVGINVRIYYPFP